MLLIIEIIAEFFFEIVNFFYYKLLKYLGWEKRGTGTKYEWVYFIIEVFLVFIFIFGIIVLFIIFSDYLWN